jgi:hypothetical protein
VGAKTLLKKLPSEDYGSMYVNAIIYMYECTYALVV